MRLRSIITTLAVSLLLAAALPLAAQEYQAESFSAPPPEELAPAVRATLASEGVRVMGPDGTLCEIWLRSPIPVAAGAGMKLGIAYPALMEGTLVGAISFPSDVQDYRRQTVKAGVYTLRYGLTPVDGNHMGVAPQRDFLLPVPAQDDTSIDTMTYDELVDAGRAATGTRHPSVWSLMTPEDNPASLPAMIHWEDEGLWLLYLKAATEPEGGAASDLSLALVVVGHAAEAP
jgi:hypothetical protein